MSSVAEDCDHEQRQQPDFSYQFWHVNNIPGSILYTPLRRFLQLYLWVRHLTSMEVTHGS